MRYVDSHRSRPGSRASRAVVAGLAMLLTFNGCKPSDEPPRQARRAIEADAGTPPPTALVQTAPPTAADFDTPVVRAPEPAPEPSEVAPDADVDVAPAPDVDESPLAEVDALLAPVSREREDKARALNTAGLRKHRKQDLRGAAASYREALEAWPAHILARFNLACALSLLGEREDALAELERLLAMHMAGADAADVLAKARTDADLTALHGDPRFRKATGSTDVVVAFARGDADAEASARRATASLTDLHWPSRLAGEDALEPGDSPRIEVLESDLIAAKAASAISASLGVKRIVLVPRLAGAPLRVVYPAPPVAALDAVPDPDGAPPTEPDPTPPPDGGTDTPPGDIGSDAGSLDAWFGPKLSASADGRTHQLQLKATGFFEWRITDANGRLETRVGRYRASTSAITFTFRRTITTPSGPDAQPDIAVDEDQTSELPVSVTDGSLTLGGVSFRR